MNFERISLARSALGAELNRTEPRLSNAFGHNQNFLSFAELLIKLFSICIQQIPS